MASLFQKSSAQIAEYNETQNIPQNSLWPKQLLFDKDIDIILDDGSRKDQYTNRHN